MHKMTYPYSEWIAVGGAGSGWISILAGNLTPFITVGTFALTLISLYLVAPKLIARIKTDYRRFKSWRRG